MSSKGLIGFGIHLARGDGQDPEQFVNLAELADLSSPSMSKDSVEVTHTDSPSGVRQFIPGLIDAGEFSATVNLVPGDSTQTEVRDDFVNGTEGRNWRITFPAFSGETPTTWTFKAFVTGFDTVTPMDDKMTHVITFKVCEVPTFA